jgi:hypothetical protein
MNRFTALSLTLVAAILAGGAAWVVTTRDVPDPLPVGDRVQAAVAGLRESNVYVAPESADLLSVDDVERLSAVAAGSSPETFVVVWEDSPEGGFYLPREGLRQIGAELGRPGYYVSVGRGDVSSDDVGIDGDYASADGFEEGEVIDQQTVAVKIAEIIAESDGRDYSEASTTGSAYWGGPIGTVGAALLIGVLIGLGLAGVAVIMWFLVRGRLESRS